MSYGYLKFEGEFFNFTPL